MNQLNKNLQQVQQRIDKAMAAATRQDTLQLLAVSKRHPAEAIRALYQLGQRRFGESYLQEALAKQQQLADLDIEWHFIGPIQSNKTRDIAEHFSWVHSVDRDKIARRLNDQRPEHLPPLNICLQVNISQESNKSGASPGDILTLAEQLAQYPRLRLRGLMAIPAKCELEGQQRMAFRALAQWRDRISKTLGLNLDTLSMGMSGDLEAAVMEGATIVRIGTDLFGQRED